MDDMDSDEMKKQAELCLKIEKIIKSFQFYNPDLQLLHEVFSAERNFKFVDFYGCVLHQELAHHFQAGVTQKIDQNKKEFVKLARMVYLMLSEKYKLKFHTIFLDVWSRMPSDYGYYFESISEDFQANISRCVDALAAQKNQNDVDDEIVQQLRWACLLSPAFTFARLLLMAADHPNIMLTILKLCKLLPDLFNDTEHRFWHNEFEVKAPMEKLTTLMFRRLICEARRHFTTAKQWENVDFIGLNLTVSSVLGEPVMRPEDLLNVALCELCSPTREPAKSIEVLTVICGRILDVSNPHALQIKFASSRREQPAPGLFLTPTIVEMALNLAEEFHGVSRSIQEGAFHMLRSIGIRMRHENVQFDEETRKKLVEEHLANCPWYIEVAMFSWFCKPLNVRVLRVPTEIYRAIEPKYWGMFEELGEHANLENPREAYFEALFQFAMIDAHAATELHSYGCTYEFHDVNLVEMFGRLLWDGEFMRVPMDVDERKFFADMLAEILRNVKHAGGNEISDETIWELMDGPVRRDIRPVVPATKIHPTRAVKALDEPAPLEWPAGAFTMPNVDLRAIFKHHKDAYDELRRQVREQYDQESAEIALKWKDEGVVQHHHQHRQQLVDKELGVVGEKFKNAPWPKSAEKN